MTRLITKVTRPSFEIIKIDLDKKVHCLRSPHYTRICTCLSRLCISYSFDTRSIGYYCHFDIRLYLLKEITNINTIKIANASPHLQILNYTNAQIISSLIGLKAYWTLFHAHHERTWFRIISGSRIIDESSVRAFLTITWRKRCPTSIARLVTHVVASCGQGLIHWIFRALNISTSALREPKL